MECWRRPPKPVDREWLWWAFVFISGVILCLSLSNSPTYYDGDKLWKCVALQTCLHFLVLHHNCEVCDLELGQTKTPSIIPMKTLFCKSESLLRGLWEQPWNFRVGFGYLLQLLPKHLYLNKHNTIGTSVFQSVHCVQIVLIKIATYDIPPYNCVV